jgi:predicted phage tail protein
MASFNVNVQNQPAIAESNDVMEMVLGISEGPILGLKGGAKEFFVGDTPLVNIDNKSNFVSFELEVFKGIPEPPNIKLKLGGSSSPTSVNTELAMGTPVVRTGTHRNIDFLELRLLINQLYANSEKKGPQSTYVDVKLEYKATTSSTWLPVATYLENPTLVDEIDTTDDSTHLGTDGDSVPSSYWDVDTLISSTTPTTPAAQIPDHAIWFNSAVSYRPKIWSGSAWVDAAGLTSTTGKWTFTSPKTGTTTHAFYNQTTTPAGVEGDFWITTDINPANPADAGRVVVMIFTNEAWQYSQSYNPTNGYTVSSDEYLRITGKIQEPFVKELRWAVANIDDTYDMRVTVKNMEDHDNNYFLNIQWESFQEVSSKPLNFPNLACARIFVQASDQFPSVQNMSGIWWGRIVNVPTNYNPDTRVYTGIWDGTWKLAWTDNPAFIVNDLVMNDRYGLNAYYPCVLNKWTVYAAGQFCDTMVGGKPLFTFNGTLSDAQPGSDLIDYVCGIFGGRFVDDGNGYAEILLDANDPAVAIFAPENVENGLFSYSYTDIATRYNDIIVRFKNPDLNWNEDRRRLQLDDHIAKYGLIPTDFTAVGCIDAAEAYRRAYSKAISATTETRMVTFTTNRQGLYLKPYQIILIADPDSNTGISGRISEQLTSTAVIVAAPISMEPGFTYQIRFQIGLEVETATVTGYNPMTRELTYSPGIDFLPEFALFTLESAGSQSGVPLPYRVLSIEPKDDDTDQIQISASFVNRNKFPLILGYTSSTDQDHSTPTDPPDAVTSLRATTVNRKIGTSLEKRLVISWV